jgi:hypothetical protein
MSARRTGIAWIVAVMLAAGCGVDEGTASPMSDPVEILEQALSSTASLGTVHARIELSASGDPQGLDGASGEGDLDLEEHELTGTVDLPPALGAASLSVVYADRELFARSGSGDWERIGGNGEADPLVFLPTVAKIADAFDAALDEPGVAARLVGTEACAAATATCYHLTVDVPPEAVWLTVQRLQGLEGVDLPMPAGVPPVELEAWVDRAELQIVRLQGGFVDAEAGTLAVEIELSAHDAAVDVSPPPSDAVAPEE